MFRRTGSRVVNTVRRGPVSSMVVVGLLGAVLAVTAIAATGQSGGPITAVKVVREESIDATNSTDYVDLPNATTTITVPSGQRALILARFSAASDCVSTATVACRAFVRILIGGVEGAPQSASNFDSTPGNAPRHSGNRALERSRGGFGGLPAGTYEVKVQYRVDDSGTFEYLGGWHLTVERSQVG